jgi:hypothetical protein
MNILDVDITRVIRWQVEPISQDVLWSPSRTVGILNPLIYQALRRSQLPESASPDIFYNDNRGVLINTGVGIVISGDLTLETKVDWIVRGMPLLISCLRSASGQLINGSETISLGHVTVDSLPTPPVPDRTTSEHVAAPAVILKSAITPEDTALALEYFEDGGPPAHRSMLVDALHAYALSDYKKAIVYAAVAMETVAATVLDSEFEKIRASTPRSSQWRVVEIPQQGGNIAKDPVFDALRTGVKFARLLHELSLYVRSRSLMLENNPLYSLARTVYKTRNEIVHHAEPQDRNAPGALAIDRDSARTSVQCALNVCNWFGEGLRFGIYDREALVYEKVAADSPIAPPAA